MTLPAFFVKVKEIEKGNEVKVLYGLGSFLVVCTENNPEDVNEELTKIVDNIGEKR